MKVEPSNTEILVVDDTVDNVKLLSQLLQNEGYLVKGALSAKSALRMCQKKKPDLILLDIMMPEVDGYELCRQLKKDPSTQDIPVIFLSALDHVQDKVRAFQIGGVDYIQKPFEAMEVLARVRTHAGLVTLQRALIEQNEQLKRMATTDALTGLVNRRYLADMAGKVSGNFALILFDIDDFKTINDQYGHHVGDEVLVRIAEITRRVIGQHGYCARWGGEEFLILLPNFDAKRAYDLAACIQDEFNESKGALGAYHFTASFGVACNQGALSFHHVIRQADAAMYQGKKSGKNRVVSSSAMESREI
ncbi:TPA: diguanylate cyclase [Vibrio vulnificus]|uniref:diguanylate cyclase n=1 Tax=Vibrio vulnificus TaxID=672 RepID=UPI000CD0FF49|nr:diguanylate cyclase [Vibrio vulnificus]POB15563.1 diguanylate cyclase response regulator [Vibrio vulnificus]HAS6021515.1 diguanylate cyclase [Vibrio vulnificus]HAS6354780.1 diguanylate cyclase [Vibrio vulnificus]HAS6367564.1 diguanylate cyclase [Vibrio vulnificus]HDY7612552.1 diguanylate cyclase [Vibrio vulnificus]